MVASSVVTAFANVLPEGGPDVHAARPEDSDRVRRMLATTASDWTDDDIDLVMSRAQTTLGGPETFKWVLPAWLKRSSENPCKGWMTVSDVLAEKLDRAGFDSWPEAQQKAVLPMLIVWLKAQDTASPDDPAPAGTDDHAGFRAWLEARTV